MFLSRIVSLLAVLFALPAFASITPTTTVLTLSASGAVAPGTAVTLTATTTASGVAVHPGQVKFCEIHGATPCTFLRILATAQLTSPAGTATYKFIPGSGTHTYVAVFLGTNTYASSTSSSSSLTVNVTGTGPSSTSFSASGTTGYYTLSATVTGQRPASPTGTISFQDTSNANAVVASASLLPGPFTPGFSVKSTLGTGATPAVAGIGDFNGDGIPDLAVPCSGSSIPSTLTIFTGNGDGNFSLVSNNSYNLAGAQDIAVADFDSDGILDLAVVNHNQNTVSILKGNGDATFTLKATLAVGNSASNIVFGDFNHDGIVDLAVVNLQDNNVSVLRGNGDGTFTALAKVPVPGTARGIAAGDFTGDGFLDLAVAEDNKLSILKGKGDGTFTVLAPFSPGFSPSGISSGDFNGDGIADLVTANVGNSNVAVLLGNGDGTFVTKTTIGTGDYAASVVVLDFNGDGIADFAAISFASTTLHFFQGNGDGTFTSFSSPTYAGNPFSVYAADFNGDGTPDLVIPDYPNSAVVLLGSVTASATATQTGVAIPGTGSHILQAAFPGDANYSSSVSTGTALTAGPATTSTTVSSLSSNTATVGDTVTVTASVADITNSAVPPAGTVAFSSQFNGMTTALGSVAVTNGSASLAFAVGSAGSNTVTAAFTPTSSISFAPSADTTGLPLTVARATPAQIAGVNNQTVQQQVAGTLTVIIAFPGPIAPTSGITLKIDDKPIAGLGKPTCVAKVYHTNCTYPFNPKMNQGTYSLTYTQLADANYNSSSGTSTVTITPQTVQVTFKPRPITSAPIRSINLN